MREITYHRATIEDAVVISALAISVWVDTYAQGGIETDFGRYIADHLSESAFAEILGGSGQVALLAYCEARLVGFALLTLDRNVDDHPETASELSKLYIHRNFKGLGIGRRLLDMGCEAVFDAGYSALWLSVYHGNSDAIAFYRRMGLEQISDHYFDLNGHQHLNHRFIRVKPLTNAF